MLLNPLIPGYSISFHCKVYIWNRLTGDLITSLRGHAGPVNAVAWLANKLGEFGVGLKAGEVILSGALCAMVTIEPGDNMTINIGGIGSASIRFE